MRKSDSPLFHQFEELLFSAYTETIPDAPSFRDNIFEYFVDFEKLLKKYGFKNETPEDPLYFRLNAEPFDYFVALNGGDELTFRLYYRMVNGNRCFSELSERFDRAFIYYHCLDEIFFRLTMEIGRLILTPTNDEDVQFLLNRKLTIKSPC